MTSREARWSLGSAASILLSYTLRGTLLSFLYLILPAILRAGGTSLAMTSLSTLVYDRSDAGSASAMLESRLEGFREANF